MAGLINVLYIDREAEQVDLQGKVENANLPWCLTFADSVEDADSKLAQGQQFDLVIAGEQVELLVLKSKNKFDLPPLVWLTLTSELQNSTNGKIFHVIKDKEGDFLNKINCLTKKDQPIKNPVNQLASKKILIGEDNMMNTKLILKMLEPWGLHPTILANGKLIVEELERNDYDLLLIDLQMPVMDGIQAIKHIRYNMNIDLKIILMTAVLFEESYTEVLPLIQGMLPKPFTAENLYDHIKKCLWTSVSMTETGENVQVAPDQKLYDLAFLHKTSRGNNKFVKEMIEIFIEQVQAFNPQIPHLIEKGDLDQLSLNIHTIKSSARHVGSIELSQLCEDIEGRLYENNTEEGNVKKMLAEFQLLSEACSKQLQQALEKM